MVFLGLAVAIGGLIGLYWSVFALVPVTIIMFLGCCAVTLANGEPALTALISTIIAAFGLQIGYLIGLTRRDSVGHFISRFNAAPSKRI
jgi:membrane protein DedA with SNARE-associated domain